MNCVNSFINQNHILMTFHKSIHNIHNQSYDITRQVHISLRDTSSMHDIYRRPQKHNGLLSLPMSMIIVFVSMNAYYIPLNCHLCMAFVIWVAITSYSVQDTITRAFIFPFI